jgi:hypothetical protein
MLIIFGINDDASAVVIENGSQEIQRNAAQWITLRNGTDNSNIGKLEVTSRGFQWDIEEKLSFRG